MKIIFDLNNSRVSLTAPPEKRLVDMLRDDLGMLATKSGCYKGKCGACYVLLNNEIVSSCLIPAFAAKSTSIKTIEFFIENGEYDEIVNGFRIFGHIPCSFCIQSKILIIHSLLEKYPEPENQNIVEAFSSFLCRCGDLTTLVDSIKFISFQRKKRKRK